MLLREIGETIRKGIPRFGEKRMETYLTPQIQ